MKVTMYETNLHLVGNGLSYYSVTPITISSEKDGSIEAKDSKGRAFSGSKDNYFQTEEEAWTSALNDANASICTLESGMQELTSNLVEANRLKSWLLARNKGESK